MDAQTPVGEGTNAAKQWSRVQERLKKDLGEDAFSAFFRRMELEGITQATVSVSVPVAGLRRQILDIYRARLLAAWQAERNGVTEVLVAVRSIATQKGRIYQAATAAQEAAKKAAATKNPKTEAKAKPPPREDTPEDASSEKPAAQPLSAAPVVLESFDGIEAVLESQKNTEDEEDLITLIKETVALHYDVTVSDLESDIKVGRYRLARHVAIFLVRSMTGMIYAKMSSYFGDRDSKTILHSVNVVKLRRSNDPAFDAEIANMEANIRQKRAVVR
ncbi:MAG TPA: helix-turn-helix domain-containing protein [Candidatus Paceibacterota bacterium]|nr:helix-turn-helix domain-containing protein [Candidatus Paceibacterota bacterium]